MPQGRIESGYPYTTFARISGPDIRLAPGAAQLSINEKNIAVTKDLLKSEQEAFEIYDGTL